MQEYLTSDSFLAELIMLCEGTKGVVVVLEGPEDMKLVKRHISNENVTLRSGIGGKQTLLSLAKKLEDRGIKNIRVLLDRDFDGNSDLDASSIEKTPGNVLLSQHHDIFMDVFLSYRFPVEEMIESHLSSSDTRTLINSHIGVVKEIIEQAFLHAFHLASIRIGSAHYDANLSFKGYPYHQFKMEKQESRPSTKDIVDLLIKRTGASTQEVPSESIVRFADDFLSNNPERMVAVIGDHDFIGILCSLLRDKKVCLSEARIREALTIGLPCSALNNILWYASLISWGEALRVRIFKCAPTERCTL